MLRDRFRPNQLKALRHILVVKQENFKLISDMLKINIFKCASILVIYNISSAI